MTKRETHRPSLHRKSDLALERPRAEAGEEGITYREAALGDIRFTALTVRGDANAPKGRTLSLSLPEHWMLDGTARDELLTALRLSLQLFFPTAPSRPLVAGLGNRRLTADSLGPAVAERVGVSAALPEAFASYFGAKGVSRVAVCVPDVFPRTGIESARTVEALAALHGADALLTVDALAARDRGRLFRVIEITDTGTVPGGGVKSGSLSITKERLGVPVVSIGIPTVVRMGNEHFLVSRSMEDELDAIAPLLAEAIDLCFGGEHLPMADALTSLFDPE